MAYGYGDDGNPLEDGTPGETCYTPDGAPYPCGSPPGGGGTTTPGGTTAPPTGDCPRGYPGGPCLTGTSAPNGRAGGGFSEGGDDWPTYFGPQRPSFDFGNAPRYKAPTFAPPSAEDALKDPGYQFGVTEGRKALEQSAAGRGTLRTGGTLKDIFAFGDRYASQHYGDVFNRALSAFDRLYAGSLAEYTPLLTEWQTKAAGTQRAGELGFSRAWEQYLAEIDRFRHNNPSATDLLTAELNSR